MRLLVSCAGSSDVEPRIDAIVLRAQVDLVEDPRQQRDALVQDLFVVCADAPRTGRVRIGTRSVPTALARQFD